MPTWSRRYFFITDAGFSWVIVSKKKDHTNVSLATPISILLCNVRMWTKEDRRFTFEIYTSKKSFVLQAETEEDMNSWMTCLQNAKNKASGIMPEISKEEGSVDQDEDQEDDSADEDEADNLDSSQNGGEKLKYNDTGLEKKNQELHSLLKSVPESETIFAYFSVALQKDIAVQGKMYVTQNLVCFYSSILSFVTVLVIDLKVYTSHQHAYSVGCQVDHEESKRVLQHDCDNKRRNHSQYQNIQQKGR